MLNPMEIMERLRVELEGAKFQEPISHVYQPLEYAWEPCRHYLERYGMERPREVLLVGMNPGPWGMGQVGVPFGAVSMVRDWMGIEGEVGQPKEVHPKRPVEGFETAKEEVSGTRLWGWARERFESPERFFSQFFVHNYCPLLIYDRDGTNRTPPKLRQQERAEVLPPCDRALVAMVEYYQPRWVIGVGAWAEKQIRSALKATDYEGGIGRVLHPSPASPKANRGWARQAEEELEAMGVKLRPQGRQDRS